MCIQAGLTPSLQVPQSHAARSLVTTGDAACSPLPLALRCGVEESFWVALAELLRAMPRYIHLKVPINAEHHGCKKIIELNCLTGFLFVFGYCASNSPLHVCSLFRTL